MMRWFLGAAAFAFLTLASTAHAQDAAAGINIFKRCSICHGTAAAAPPGVGPQLGGVVGRKAGSLKGYSYSPAMTGAGFSWTKPKLDAFLLKPSDVVKGTKMFFPGLPNAKERADVIAYLATLKR